MGLMFFLSTCSLIFFRQLMEAEENQKRFQILSHMGYKIRELKKIILKQSATVFFLPLLLSYLHTWFALSLAENILKTEYTGFFFILISLYTLLYTLYFLLSNRFYGKVCIKR